MKSALPYLVASFIFHWDWIAKTLPKSHPFFTSLIFSQNYMHKWGELVRTSLKEDAENHMIASGVPNSITILKMLYENRKEWKSQMEERVPCC